MNSVYQRGAAHLDYRQKFSVSARLPASRDDTTLPWDLSLWRIRRTVQCWNYVLSPCLISFSIHSHSILLSSALRFLYNGIFLMRQLRIRSPNVLATRLLVPAWPAGLSWQWTSQVVIYQFVNERATMVFAWVADVASHEEMGCSFSLRCHYNRRHRQRRQPECNSYKSAGCHRR